MLFSIVEKLKTSHEEVIFFSHKDSKLKAIIAIHSTKLGPALGGCRIFPYQTDELALRDALQLSETMTYKAIMAGLKVGGGKAVIIANPDKHKTKKLLRAFGSYVSALNGRFITGKDMGLEAKDLQYIAEESSFILGSSSLNIDYPGLFTAKGVYYGIKEATRLKLKKNSLHGIKILVHGAGSVGTQLINFLLQEQAQVFVFDTKKLALNKLKQKFPCIKIISKNNLFSTPHDIFSPCSTGNIINKETIQKLKCSIIAGGANNQLSSYSLARVLTKKEILYIPDFIINSGGLIYASAQITPKKTNKWVENKIKKIPFTIRKIYKISQKENLPLNQVALNLAKKRL